MRGLAITKCYWPRLRILSGMSTRQSKVTCNLVELLFYRGGSVSGAVQEATCHLSRPAAFSWFHHPALRTSSSQFPAPGLLFLCFPIPNVQGQQRPSSGADLSRGGAPERGVASGRDPGLLEGNAEQTFGLSSVRFASAVDSVESPRHKITKGFLLNADWGGVVEQSGKSRPDLEKERLDLGRVSQGARLPEQPGFVGAASADLVRVHQVVAAYSVSQACSKV